MERLGVLGGTFNPPHRGHLRLGHTFARALGLTRVLVIPTCLPPHKEADGAVGQEERLTMCRLAFGADELFEVSDREIRRGGKSYTVDTVAALQDENPNAALYLLLGSDMLLSFHQWREPEKILRLCTVCAASRRDTDDEARMRAYLAAHYPQVQERFVISPVEPVELSSTALRERAACGGDLVPYIPAPVCDYIREKGLYHDGRRAE